MPPDPDTKETHFNMYDLSPKPIDTIPCTNKPQNHKERKKEEKKEANRSQPNSFNPQRSVKDKRQ